MCLWIARIQHLLLRVKGVEHAHPAQPVVIPGQRPQAQRLPWGGGNCFWRLQLVLPRWILPRRRLILLHSLQAAQMSASVAPLPGPNSSTLALP